MSQQVLHTPQIPAHASTHNAGGSDAMTIDAAAATGSLRTLGTGSAQAAAGNHTHSAGSVTNIRPFDPASMTFEYEDFVGGAGGTAAIGKFAWTAAGATQNPTVQSGEVGHPGIARLPTGAANNSMSYLIMQNGAPLHGSDLFDCTFVFRQNTADTTNGIRVGVGAGVTAGNPTAGVFLEKLPADTSYYPVSRNASTGGQGTALAGVDTNWHKVRVRRIDASTVGVRLDAGTEITFTSNLPNVALVPFFQITNSASNALARTIDCDYADMLVTGLAR